MHKTIWTKDFVSHLFTSFLVGLSYYFLLSTIPIIAVKSFGADNSQAGYVIGIYTLSSLIIRPFAGYALDSFSRKKTFLLSLGFFALFSFSYYLATTFIIFLLLRSLHGFAWGVVTTGSSTIAADIVPHSRRGEGIGYFGLSIALSTALGPLLALRLAENSHYNRIFGAAGIIVVIAFFVSTMVKHPSLPLKRKTLSWNSFIEPRVLPICMVQFFLSLTYGGLISFISLYCEEINIANGGLFFLFYAIAMIFTRPFSGRVMDRRGPGQVVTVGLLCLMAGFMFLWASHSINIFILAAVLIGLGAGIYFPSMQTMVVNLVEPQYRGTANSTFSSTVDLGAGTGSIVMGWLANLTSIGTMYLASSLIHLIPLTLLLLYVIKHYNSKMIRDESIVVNKDSSEANQAFD